MELRKFGKTGMQVSPLGFGGAEIGFENATQADVERLLFAGLDAGLNVIDTGECYRDSEEKIGAAIMSRRREVLLFTKVGHASGLPFDDWSPALIGPSIDRSLKRLQTDAVDLILLHSCEEDVLRKGDVIAELCKARDAGKTRFIGYSGDRTDAPYAIGLGVFDALETSVNIADQECLTLTLPKAEAAQMGVIAKRPVANVAWRWGERYPEEPYHLAYWERFRKLKYPFLTSPDAVSVALRFTLSQYVHTAIVGTKNPDRWAANAKLLAQGPLPKEQIEAIRARWQEIADEDWVGQT
jgi:hypothetical protein